MSSNGDLNQELLAIFLDCLENEDDGCVKTSNLIDAIVARHADEEEKPLLRRVLQMKLDPESNIKSYSKKEFENIFKDWVFSSDGNLSPILCEPREIRFENHLVNEPEPVGYVKSFSSTPFSCRQYCKLRNCTELSFALSHDVHSDEYFEGSASDIFTPSKNSSSFLRALKRNNDDLKDRLSTTEYFANSMESKYESVTKRCDEQEEEIMRLTQELREKRDLADKLEDLEAYSKKLEDELTSLKQNYVRALEGTRTNSSLLDKIEQLKNDLLLERQECDEVKNRFSQLTQEYEDCRGSMEKNVISLKKQNSLESQKVAQYSAENAELLGKVMELKEENYELRSEIRDLQKETVQNLETRSVSLFEEIIASNNINQTNNGISQSNINYRRSATESLCSSDRETTNSGTQTYWYSSNASVQTKTSKRLLKCRASQTEVIEKYRLWEYLLFLIKLLFGVFFIIILLYFFIFILCSTGKCYVKLHYTHPPPI